MVILMVILLLCAVRFDDSFAFFAGRTVRFEMSVVSVLADVVACPAS